MLTSSLTGLFAPSAQTTQKPNAKLTSSLAALVSGAQISNKTDNVSDLSVAMQLQNQLAGVREVNGNIAKALSLTEVADNGAEGVQTILSQLKDIAQQASADGLDSGARTKLNNNFQNLLKKIDQTVQSTRFGNENVLDGSLSGSNALSLQNILNQDQSDESLAQLSIGSLSTDALFGGAKVDVLSVQGATAALAKISKGQENVQSLHEGIASFQSNLEYAGATFSSAAFNLDASRSLLDGADNLSLSTEDTFNLLQKNSDVAINTQVKRLPPSMLELIG